MHTFAEAVKEVPKMSRPRECSPCEGCLRVAEPHNCENKQCKRWGIWFLKRWEKIHGFYERYARETEGDK